MSSKLIQRTPVAHRSKCSDYKQDLRKDFLYSCAYCTTAEIELKAKRFEIEHYLPEAHFAAHKTKFTNLLWSCEECNSSKGDFFSGCEPGLRGYSIFRPDRQRIEDHFFLKNDKLHGKTQFIGIFTIEMLFLNSKRLKDLRFRRTEENRLEDDVAYGIRHIEKEYRRIKDPQNAFKLINALKQIKKSFDDAIKEIAREKCAAQSQDYDETKIEKQRTRTMYLAKLLKQD